MVHQVVGHWIQKCRMESDEQGRNSHHKRHWEVWDLGLVAQDCWGTLSRVPETQEMEWIDGGPSVANKPLGTIDRVPRMTGEARVVEEVTCLYIYLVLKLHVRVLLLWPRFPRSARVTTRVPSRLGPGGPGRFPTEQLRM